MEKTYVELVGAVREAIKIPLAVKLSPFITALPGFVTRVAGAGANGLVLFNRFLQPDLDIETLEVVPTHELSTSSDLRLPLRWVAILYGRIKVDMAITGGVHTSQDVLKSLMAGANVVMMASELIQKGPARITEILAEMREWMDKHEYESVRQMRGSMSQRGVKEPAAFERANYMKSLTSYDNRV
jgi:dihydroorotate dehydrogenase (fumarate)